MLNPYFLQGANSEQNLLQDIINESIKIHGVDVYYLPRRYVTKRKVVREVIESKFTDAFPLEAYIDTYDGYEGAGTLMSKFGIKAEVDLNLTISKERFSTYITPLIENIPDIELPTRPKEGDLIWFPLGDRLFEIKYVEHEQPFYQLQKNYVYVLRCELFRYQDEIIDTGYSFIDDNTQNQGYSETYKVVGVGSTATATCTIVNGGVVRAVVTNRGDGYTAAPEVTFSPSSGQTAIGIATMIGGIIDLCEPDASRLRVQGIEIINPGFGYTSPPTIAFYGGSGSGAQAYSIIGNGVIGNISIGSSGSGYTTTPTVNVVGVASTPAVLRPVIQDGTVKELRIITAGIGYTIAPQIIIGSPGSVSSGNFIVNEVITGSVTGNTARVKKWDITNNLLEIKNMTGSFNIGEIVTGSESNAQYTIGRSLLDITYDEAKQINVDINPFAQNNDIQSEADKVVDDTEYNIFGKV